MCTYMNRKNFFVESTKVFYLLNVMFGCTACCFGIVHEIDAVRGIQLRCSRSILENVVGLYHM